MERRNDGEPNRSNKSYGTNRTYAASLIPAHGGYRQLKSYQTAEIIYDATVAFCARFVDRRSRTTDQMIQAARSGKQNIAEGSQASGTSKKTELKLVSVARASLEELLVDYQDFLRQRNLPLWPKDHPQSLAIRRTAYKSDRSYQSYRPYVERSSPETAANTLICLIHQANYLLDRQLAQLERQFLAEGGFTEHLYHARKHHRRTNRSSGQQVLSVLLDLYDLVNHCPWPLTRPQPGRQCANPWSRRWPQTDPDNRPEAGLCLITYHLSLVAVLPQAERSLINYQCNGRR